jgi:hypothetical protein
MAFTAGKRRVHTTFEDGVEMVEEYDPISLQLMGMNKIFYNGFI